MVVLNHRGIFDNFPVWHLRLTVRIRQAEQCSVVSVVSEDIGVQVSSVPGPQLCVASSRNLANGALCPQPPAATCIRASWSLYLVSARHRPFT